jgi:transposase-like protein
MDKIKSLVEARREFDTQEKCEAYLESKRWPNGVTCPRCGSQDVTYMASRRQWQCECRYQFSVTAGTVFHRTHIDLPRWLMAVWLMCYSPKGISGKQIQRELGVTYKTAWYMAKRIRWAMQHNLIGMVVEGEVEIDEAVVKADGGKATGNVTYQAKDVLGLASRTHGTLRMMALKRLTHAEIDRVCIANLGMVQRIYTDEAGRYKFLEKFGLHRTLNHWLSFADDEVHVNHVENAWSLFKRGLIGVYHHVSAKCLQEYLDEFAFRCSHRQERAVLVDLVLASC